MATTISSLNYNYYHNEIKNETFHNQQPKKIMSYENIPTLEGDSLDHGKIHHHSKNGTNGTITFPLKSKILRNVIFKGYNLNENNNTITKGSLLFCLAENKNNKNIGTKKEEDICTVVDLETLNILLAIYYGKQKENNEEKDEEEFPYWKRWHFVGYLRNELHQTVKAKGYRLLNIDVSGVTQGKNYWNRDHEIQQRNELFVVLKKQWIRGAGKHVYQWIPMTGHSVFDDNIPQKEKNNNVICVGSILKNKDDANNNNNDHEKFISIYL